MNSACDDGDDVNRRKWEAGKDLWSLGMKYINKYDCHNARDSAQGSRAEMYWLREIVQASEHNWWVAVVVPVINTWGNVFGKTQDQTLLKPRGANVYRVWEKTI